MEPALAVGPDRVVHIVWSDNTNYQGSGSDRDIFYKTRTIDGIWSSAEIVTINSNVDCYVESNELNDVYDSEKYKKVFIDPGHKEVTKPQSI